ncbi:thioredoxin [candidate division WWE3 bacterium RIFOXYC1_FULL_39_7]|uniref:Thioredoxin n=2 Tax=Katanobacteria TaxID=422282 RepID=A0A1F4X7L3_UNCKA|nr:MAG: thioredoxin [candidate division WWE3 bacterium RIFOXYC1_FULL_39_7]OGC77656.1 MAG: thioredoxin [candidate division WWE3 bacterium RIFOXYD1_FULL_39_9]
MIQLIDFYADWCGPCKIMEPIFQELEKELQGKVEFKRIDVETDPETAGRFGVLSIPTFVILKDEKEIDRKVGAMPKEILRSWINSNLNK